MKVTIIILVLGFYYYGCYANPSRCICALNPEISSLIQTGLLPYGHEQVEERIEDPAILEPKMRQKLTVGSGNGVPIRPGKKRENSGQNGVKVYTGSGGFPIIRGRRVLRPDIQLQQEYVRKLDHSADGTYGDDEYEF